MPIAGDSYRITLKEAHLKWGRLSNTGIPRNRSKLEAYIPIPAPVARGLSIPEGTVYQAISDDGLYKHPLIASGSQGRNLEYGKNFESQGSLKILGRWLKVQLNAKPGDELDIKWTGPTNIELSFIRNVI